MPVRLTVKQRNAAGTPPQELMLSEPTITLGRDQACEVQLNQQAVSRQHARITRDGELFFLEDLGSSFGTQLNGKPVTKNDKRLLNNRDVIGIAQFDVTFENITAAAKSGETRMVAREVMKSAFGGAGPVELPFFRVMNGPNEGKRIEVSDAQEYIVGRDDEADIQLKDDLVSRQHAKIRRDWHGTHVQDLKSRNGIKVNKKRVTDATLKDRDELEVGNFRLLYVDPSEGGESNVVIARDGEGDEGAEPDDRVSPTLAEVSAASVPPEDEAAPPPSSDNVPPPHSGAPVSSASDASAEEEEVAEEGEDEDGDEGEGDGEEDEAQDEPEEAPPRPKFLGIDLRNKQALVFVGVAVLMAVLSIGFLVLLIAGA